jgi:hypothetical protein
MVRHKAVDLIVAKVLEVYGQTRCLEVAQGLFRPWSARRLRLWSFEVRVDDRELATGGSNGVPPKGEMDSPEFRRLCSAIRGLLTPDIR